MIQAINCRRELQEIEEHERLVVVFLSSNLAPHFMLDIRRRSFILPNTSNAQRQLLVGNLAVQSASTHPQQQADVPSNAQAHPVQVRLRGSNAVLSSTRNQVRPLWWI